MIEYKNHRRIERHMFDTRDLDALKVNPQRKPHHGNYDATNHLLFRTCSLLLFPLPTFSDPCSPCSSVAAFRRFDAIILMLSQSIQNPFA